MNNVEFVEHKHVGRYITTAPWWRIVEDGELSQVMFPSLKDAQMARMEYRKKKVKSA